MINNSRYRRVEIDRFGGPDVLALRDEPLPEPGPGEVRVRLTSVGMNHADLMSREGEYKISSGDPPFTPGLEGGGVIDVVGPDVQDRRVGQRVILGAELRKRRRVAGTRRDAIPALEGTYRTHFIAHENETQHAPNAIHDNQLGAIWLTYLTAWGCLVWRHRLQPWQVVAIPAASSGVGLAAAQVARRHGARPIGLTTKADKAHALRGLATSVFDDIVVTTNDDGSPRKWYRDLLAMTGGRGIDVFFDPVGAGEYLQMEIRALAQRGTIWVYGLLGSAGEVDVSPLIRKYASIRGWLLTELVDAGGEELQRGYDSVLSGFETGDFRQHIAQEFPLSEVRRAHEEMAKGAHIGKLVLRPDQG